MCVYYFFSSGIFIRSVYGLVILYGLHMEDDSGNDYPESIDEEDDDDDDDEDEDDWLNATLHSP